MIKTESKSSLFQCGVLVVKCLCLCFLFVTFCCCPVLVKRWGVLIEEAQQVVHCNRRCSGMGSDHPQRFTLWACPENAVLVLERPRNGHVSAEDLQKNKYPKKQDWKCGPANVLNSRHCMVFWLQILKHWKWKQFPLYELTFHSALCSHFVCSRYVICCTSATWFQVTAASCGAAIFEECRQCCVALCAVICSAKKPINYFLECMLFCEG